MSKFERSSHITEGVTRAPNRAMYYGMGYQEKDFANPMIGVANGHSTITPCNSGLQPLTDAAVEAIRQAKGNPQVFEGCQIDSAFLRRVSLTPQTTESRRHSARHRKTR